MVTGTLFICLPNEYASINLGSTLSDVTLLIVGQFEGTLELIVKLIGVSTPFGEVIIAKRVCRKCIVNVVITLQWLSLLRWI